MKTIVWKTWATAALALCTLPTLVWAQQEKEATTEKIKEQKRQQVVITINGDNAGKTLIEIDGDKVKVNGKDAADLKDIQVRVNNFRVPNIAHLRATAPSRAAGAGSLNGRFMWVDSNRAMLGVSTQAHEKGAEVMGVNKESAAEKAGLKKGDVLTRIDNRKIEETDDVTDAIRAHKPGDKVSLTFLRDGKEQKATAELGRWRGVDVKGLVAPRELHMEGWGQFDQFNTFPKPPTPPSAMRYYRTSSNGPRLGLSVQDTDDGKGVKVLEVEEEGTAAKAGLKENDVITSLDGQAVNSADEISKLMKEKKDQPSVRLQLTRDGKQQTVEVRIPRKLKTADL